MAKAKFDAAAAAAAHLSGATPVGQNLDRGDSQIVCPHCQVRGQVRTDKTKVKRGVSGGKATGAIMTGGVSLFVVGLSRKQEVTTARCGNCKAQYQF